MLLKDVYTLSFLENLSFEIVKIDHNFNQKKFLNIHKDFPKLELKERMSKISSALYFNISQPELNSKINILKKVILEIKKDKFSNLSLIIYADFIEKFCDQNDFDLAMTSFEFFTEFGSSEFGVRKFLEIDENRALKYFLKWSKSNNFHVRRLASEGCRPLLPWGKVLRNIKENPENILQILENLKFDNSNYVKKSVANNLNDISKNHPDLVLKTLKNWKNLGVSMKLISHALRTLLKNGNIEALKIIGINSDISKNISKINLTLEKNEIEIGDILNFKISFQNNDFNSLLRLEYQIYFLKLNKSYSKKIFQISPIKKYQNKEITIFKKHNFKDLSTRKHNSGKHFISLVINGNKVAKKEFMLNGEVQL